MDRPADSTVLVGRLHILAGGAVHVLSCDIAVGRISCAAPLRLAPAEMRDVVDT